MMTWLIALALAALVSWAVWRTIQRARHGSACCGDHAEVPRQRPRSPLQRGAQSFHCTLEIGGMTCDQCARRVENALNTLPGAHARVRLHPPEARLSAAAPIPVETLRDTIHSAGYVLLSMHEN